MLYSVFQLQICQYMLFNFNFRQDVQLFSRTDFPVLILFTVLLQNQGNKQKIWAQKTLYYYLLNHFLLLSTAHSITHFMNVWLFFTQFRGAMAITPYFFIPAIMPSPLFVEKPYTILFIDVQIIYTLGSTVYIHQGLFSQSMQQSKVD